MRGEVANLEVVEGPGVCRVVDSNAGHFRSDVPLFLVMDYVPGPTLAEYTRATPQALPVALQVTGSLLRTLAHCHNRRVIHRDIKPNNIVLRDGDPAHPVLLDFGLSFNDDGHPDSFETASGQHLGNRFFVLPEYHSRDGDKRDSVSDLTQCVGLLFWLLTGRNPDVPVDEQGLRPHERGSARQYMQALQPPVRERLARVFDMGFMNEKAKRWQSAESLTVAIEAILQGGSEGGPVKAFSARMQEVRARAEARPDRKRITLVAALIDKIAQATRDAVTTANQQLEGTLSLGIASGAMDKTRSMATVLVVSDLVRGSLLGNWTVGAQLVESEFVVSFGVAPNLTAVARVALYDPQAETLLAEGVQDAVAKVVEGCFAEGG